MRLLAPQFWITLCLAFSHGVSADVRNKAETHYQYGNSLRGEGRYSEAIAEYQRALALQPGTIRFLNNLGTTYLHNREPQKAIAVFTRSCSLTVEKFGKKSSRATACHSLLASAYEDAGMVERSLAGHRTAYERYLETEGKDGPDRLYWLQLLVNPLMKLGRSQEAIELYEAFLADLPSESQLHGHITELLASIKEG